MGNDLVKILEYIKNYVDAIDRGITKFSNALPLIAKQHMEMEARRKLNTTREAYISAIKTKVNNYVLVIELDRDNWIANAVETGLDNFDMKKTHLSGPRARISKSGFRYLRVPIGKQKDEKGGGTLKSQEFQQKINEVLRKPKFGIKRLRALPDGTLIESQPVLSSDPMLRGFYRIRTFESATAFHSGKQKPSWQYVLFRTMSENPLSRSKWKHPGIKPVRIMRSTERWLVQNAGKMLEEMISSEIETLNSRFSNG